MLTWSLLKQIRWVDLVDILILAFIFYRFLLILQGTRAIQMLTGLTFLSLLAWFSASWELYSLSWLLNHFFDYFFIILLVVFQDQIRSALVSFSGMKLLKGQKSNIDQQVEEVVAAAFALSREKIGALIVFELNHGLLNYSLTGTRLDARIHSDVIYSIFQSKSPLHDGALIIQAGLIQSAGCFLPLSKNIEIDRQYGTRHRAALGITEVSDAVVVVVSEETGKVNLCVNTVFEVMDTPDSLRKKLKHQLLDINPRPKLQSILS